jgi:hypothetical protein
VVSCSLEAFWSCYSILKFPLNIYIYIYKLHKKQAIIKKGFYVCFLFVSVVVLCDYLCVQARVSSLI